MKNNLFVTAMALPLFLVPGLMSGQAPSLGTASGFALFTGSGAFGNTGGATNVTGDIGTNVGTISGFPPGVLSGSAHAANATSASAATDVASAYSFLNSVACGSVIGTSLGGQTLTPNNYCIGASASLTGTLTLNALGNPNALFIIKVNGTLTANSSSKVNLINGASKCNVYWQVNGAVSLGVNSVFNGNIIANNKIDLLQGASLFGRGLTTNGAITMKNNIANLGLPPAAAAISANGSTSFCSGGSVVLSGNSGGTWNTGLTSPSITVNQSGSYYVVYTSGCLSSTSNTISVNISPSPVISVQNETVCAGNSAVLIASGASTYSWSPGANLNTTSGGTVVASPASTTVYTVTGTNTLGCSSSASASVVVLPNPGIELSPSSHTMCAGSNVVLMANGASSYTWGPAAGLSSTTGSSVTASPSSSMVYTVTGTNSFGCTGSATSTVVVNPLPAPSITAGGPLVFCQGNSVTLSSSAANSYTWSTSAGTQSINVNSSGSYFVSVTDANGCSATSPAVSVTVNPLPTASITPDGPTTFCQGGSVNLTANAAGSYTWSTGANTQSINVNSSGNYFVSVTDGNGCSATSSAVSVTVNPLPTPSITADGPTVFCQGGSVNLTSSAASSYTWSTSASTQSINVNSSGSYFVSVTDANGCSATSAAVSVTVNPLPTPSITADGPAVFCQGGSVNLMASAASSYTWSTSAGTQSINVNSSGNYFVSVTDANGCSATSAAVSVTVNPLPTVSITPGGPTTFCDGGSVTLSSSAANSYSWSTSATTQNITVYTTGNYVVTVTDGNGCMNSAAASVKVNPNPTVTVNNATICEGSSATLTAGGAATYTWLPGNSTGSSLVVSPTSSSSYTVTGTSLAACTGSAIATVIVHQNPTVSGTAGPNTIYLCYGPNCSTLTANVGCSTPYTFTWSSGHINTAAVVCPTVSSSYSITVRDTNNCTATGVVNVNVVDACCGSNNNPKVIICHNGHEICVSSNAVPAHLAHGDQIGPCASSRFAPRFEAEETIELSTGLAVYPNPFSTGVNIKISNKTEGVVKVTVRDINGKVISELLNTKVAAGETTLKWEPSSDIRCGIYFCEVTGPEGSQNVKLILVQ
jgi:hypothetical protein